MRTCFVYEKKMTRSYGYSKMEMEDPEELQHRRARFLIHKVLQQAATKTRKPSYLRVRIRRLKIKIGKTMKNLNKRILSGITRLLVK
ncbi:hypothetical protein AgCh_028253 [Apium graveolens]